MPKEYSLDEMKRRRQMNTMDTVSVYKSIANSAFISDETKARARKNYDDYEDDIASGRESNPKSDEKAEEEDASTRLRKALRESAGSAKGGLIKKKLSSGGLVARGMGAATHGGQYRIS